MLERLNLANLSLNDANLEPLLEVIENNQTLKAINLETNFLSGQFLARIFESAKKNETLEEIKAVNQNAPWTSESETLMTEAIQANEGLLKVSIQTRRPENRNKIEKATIRNREIVRIRRMHQNLMEKRAFMQ